LIWKLTAFFQVAISMLNEKRKTAERERTRLILHGYNAVLPSLLESLFISASLFYRSRATPQERSSCAITFMHLQLWHWWWSAFQLYWAHLLFILQLTIIINCWLCTRLLT